MKIDLYDYQRTGFNALRADIKKNQRTILVAPTGSGKTIIAGFIIQSVIQKHRRVLFLAHRRELINQCSSALDKLDIPHGVIMAKHWRQQDAQLAQIASVQTLARREIPKWDLLVIDECHHTLATSYRRVIDSNKNGDVVGLTATPLRGNGDGLGKIYRGIIQVATMQGLVDMGRLVPARTFAPSTPDLGRVHIKHGDYLESDLDNIMNRPDLVGDLILHWRKLANGRRTVVFAVNVAHSKTIVDQFINNGIPAEHLDAKTSVIERQAILNRLESGETLLVSNVGILTEGWDCPQVSCAVLARPTLSLGLYLQMSGRVVRASPGKIDAIILDHAGCAITHGLIADDRDWSLKEKKKRRKGEDESTSRVCRQCFAVFATMVPACPECGLEVPKTSLKKIIHVDGPLVEIVKKDNIYKILADLDKNGTVFYFKEGLRYRGSEIPDSLKGRIRLFKDEILDYLAKGTSPGRNPTAVAARLARQAKAKNYHPRWVLRQLTFRFGAKIANREYARI